jgi:hypothetical protein
LVRVPEKFALLCNLFYLILIAILHAKIRKLGTPHPVVKVQMISDYISKSERPVIFFFNHKPGDLLVYIPEEE